MTGFVPPPYPYDRLDEFRERAAARHDEIIDCSIGTPHDPPPPAVLEALATSGAARGYPPSVGSKELHDAVRAWFLRRFGWDVSAAKLAAAVGTKELVAGLPHWLRLRRPDLDTVLYPAISYPSYAMGAILAGARPVPVPVDEHWRIDLTQIDPADAARALCLWVNTPGNPAGGLDDLGEAAAWGRAHGVPVFSDECYIEFTWGEPHSILEHGIDGVVAVHSLSKRSNLAGARVGFYLGEPELVHYLREVRKHAGFMVPGPVQHAGAVALADDAHVDEQRERYRTRLEAGIELFAALGVEVPMPGGGFYLWAPAPDGDAWGFAERLALDLGLLVSPGDLYGDAGAGHVRLAVVHPVDRLDLVRSRIPS